jgi:hypothetical protein
MNSVAASGAGVKTAIDPIDPIERGVRLWQVSTDNLGEALPGARAPLGGRYDHSMIVDVSDVLNSSLRPAPVAMPLSFLARTRT